MNRRREGRATRQFGRVRSAIALVLGAVVSVSTATVAAPPVRAATTLQVNGEAWATNNPSVTLTFGEVARTPISVTVTNYPENINGLLIGETLPWSPSIAWSLEAAEPDSERFVYAQLRYSENEWSDVMADWIWLDRTAPEVSVAINGDAEFLGDPWDWNGGSYTFDDVSLDMHVSDTGPGYDPIGYAVSRDGVTWENRPFYGWLGWGKYSATYNLIGMNWNEGPRRIWVKWRDTAGNWSAPATDSIVVRYLGASRLIVNGGQGYSDGFGIDVQVPVDIMPPEGVDTVHVTSNHLACPHPPVGAGCPTRIYRWFPGMSIRWDLSDPTYGGSTKEGGRMVAVWLKTKTGRWSAMSEMIVVDSQPAVTGPPRPTVTHNSTVTTSSSSNVTADIRWSSSGTGSPVAANQLMQSTNAGSWGYVALSNPLATSAPRTLTPGAAYRFRTRNQDRAGNWGSWTYGATFGIAPTQQTSTLVKYAGTWTAWARTDAWGGSLRYTRSKGASATMTFTGRGIAVIGPRSGNGGEMDVYIDGKLVNTAYQRSNVFQPRRVIFTMSWTSSGTHTIKIVKKYDNRDYPIYLDGFLVLK